MDKKAAQKTPRLKRNILAKYIPAQPQKGRTKRNQITLALPTYDKISAIADENDCTRVDAVMALVDYYYARKRA